jgi:DNA polymerase III delta prime subunit
MKLTHPSHFLGRAGQVATICWNQLGTIAKAEDPIERCLLFTGFKGTGKTSLAVAFAAALSGGVDTVAKVEQNKALTAEFINGGDFTVDTVRRWRENGAYLPLYGTCRVQIVDELEGAQAQALKMARTYLSSLPPLTVFIATTNQEPENMQEAIASRFQKFYFTKVSPADIGPWLVSTFSVPLNYADKVAAVCDGDVREAKGKCISYLKSVAAVAA